MSNKVTTYLCNVLLILVGVLLIVFYNRINLMEYIVVIIGLLFVIPSAVNLISVAVSHKDIKKKGGKSTSVSYSISSIAALAVGLFMVIKPIIFVSIMTYFLASLLVIGGLYHLIFLISGYKTYGFPGWFYVFPVLILLCGIIILASPIREIQSTVVLITGICFVAFAFNNMLEDSRRDIVLQSRNPEE